MIKITDKEVYSTEGKYVHRIGTDSYFKRCSKLKDDSEEDFEEVESIPSIKEEDIAYKDETIEKAKAMFFQKNISSEINTYGLSNNEALAVKEFYPEWSADSVQVKKGERYQCDNLLWEALKEHTTQESWKPSIDTSSLWKVVDEEHEGTIEDPIPYNPPMEVFEGKYYTQNGSKYKCTRDSGIPLSHDLSALVGTYVELV